MAQCTATAKTSGNQCKRASVPGATVCVRHGGGAPQVRAAAERRIAKANLDGEIGKLLHELSDQSMPPLIEGLEAAVDHCARMVAVTRFIASGRDVLGVNRFKESVVDPAVTEYGNWLDRYARATKLALDAGIDERRTRVSELDAGILFDAIDKAFNALALDQAQRDVFRSSLAESLRAIDGGNAA